MIRPKDKAAGDPELIQIRLVQLKNARGPMEVTPSGIVILTRLVQLRKASAPMETTPSGIVILTRLLEPSNA